MLRNILVVTMALLLWACSSQTNTQEKYQLDSSVTSVSQVVDTKPEGVLFQVDEVDLAPTLLQEYNAKQVFELTLGKKAMFIPEEHTNLSLVYSTNNAFVQTLQECYDNHRPLVLTPDMLWLTICQGVSIHINQRYDKLKNQLFLPNKPNVLSVRNDSLAYGAKHWKVFINEIAGQTKQYTKQDYYSFFVGDFTTTTPVIQTAYQVTLLHTYKKAFEYVAETGCGIPSILITGTKEDWQKIIKRLDQLPALGLTEWKNELVPIIQEFAQAAGGKPNKAFWQQMYKTASEYNAVYLSGWMIKLFPYIKETEGGILEENSDMMKKTEKLIPNPFLLGDDYLKATLMTDNFPAGILKVPVMWNNHFKHSTTSLELCAGFFGIRQYPDKSLAPLISWAVCEAKAPAITPTFPTYQTLKQKHRDANWSPNFVEQVSDSAIYHYKKFHNQANSLAYIRQVISDSLHTKNTIQQSAYQGDTLTIEVLTNGKIGNVSLQKNKQAELNKYLKNLLKKLPEPWLPALAPIGVALDMDDEEEQMNKKIRVNSVVKLRL